MTDSSIFNQITGRSGKKAKPPKWIGRLPESSGLMAQNFSPEAFSPAQMIGDVHQPGGLMTDFNVLARQLGGFPLQPPQTNQVNNEFDWRNIFRGILNQKMGGGLGNPQNSMVRQVPREIFLSNMGTRG